VMARSESSTHFAVTDEAATPSYLRRKVEQGKRFDQT
jgi:hypothetical protein